ncbi:MAG: ATP-binding protein [Rhodobiaceae bacterium]|nr:ATP-binding protein [Rhodobiaceae bacterium]
MAKFKARARTLDMLGKQQIAGIPTALHELFKNAYDAYANEVTVDFFRKSRILLIRDDGVGMSKSDFENRWLTIGTESKLQIEGNLTPPDKAGADVRPTMGEKGIGRLAIATIGPIVLILTRAHHGSDRNLVACLIHWGLFEIPGVDLDEITIPLRTLKNAKEVCDDLVSSMRDELILSLEALSSSLLATTFVAGIKHDLKSWTLPIDQLFGLQSGPSLQADGSGTHFIVHPVGDELEADIDEPQSNGATNLERMLLGFSNQLGKSAHSPMSATFRDHLMDGQVIDRIGEQQFFTDSEFELADHRVEGRFDERGNFKGRLSIYGSDFREFEIPLFPGGHERSCGAFDISFAYVQGNKRDSKIPLGLHEPLLRKLDQIGGLYIYKNGIRVLPYGNSDYDFLEIERRRTLSASYYFFSYRRMFGAINITAQRNSALKEKAGREGFQSNKAYRQFREQLMKFFEELAARYFREDGAFAEEWALEREALQKEYTLLQKRQRSVKSLRAKLSGELSKYFDSVSEARHVQELEDILSGAQTRVSKLLEDQDLEGVAEQIIHIEAEMLQQFQSFLDKYRISRPSSAGLTKSLARQWEQYQRSFSQDILTEYDRSRIEARETIGQLAESAKVHLDSRMRLTASLSASEDFSKKALLAQRKSTQEALSKADKYVNNELSEARVILQETKDDIDLAVSSFRFESATSDELDDLRNTLEEKLLGARKKFENRLAAIRMRLERVPGDETENDVFSDETMAALETQLEVMREDYSQTLELAQLGMAVSIVQHEFESNVRGVRRSLKSMQRWADKNAGLREIYDDIRDGFDHLDNYLSLFTPLDRRLRRRKTKITGQQIAEFIEELFGERFDRHGVKFEVTRDGAAQSVDSFASVILPVFVNLVDNAIHWLSKKDGSRLITLDATAEGFLLSDNGPGISAMDRELVFEFGYSKKYGGQGMGLYIAKTSLNKEDLDIRLIVDASSGAKFEIFPKEAP